MSENILNDDIINADSISEELIATDNSSTEEVSTTESINSDLDMMKKIADDKQSIEDITMLTSSKVTDQLKVFVISQARNELRRVVKLTEYLDKLELNFMNKVDKAIDDDELSLREYRDIISTITSLLERSSNLMSKVLQDDSLMTIMNTTIYGNSEVKSTSVVANLKDSHSRERVRTVINRILANTNNYIDYTDVTDQQNNNEE